jgi:hypothetical protein
MFTIRSLVILPLLLPSVGVAQDIEYLGMFSNVSSRDGDHCEGDSLKLWRYRDRLFGLFDRHAGLCGDQPCAVIQDATLDPRTRRLRFWVSMNEEKIRFDGRITGRRLEGRFNGSRTHLAMSQDEADANFEPNRNIPAWCEFWGSIRRCAGVRQMCDSLGAAAGKKAN